VRSLVPAPRQTSVIEDEPVEWRQPKIASDIETANDREAQLGVGNRDSAAGKLRIVARGLASTDDRRTVNEVEIGAVVTTDEIGPADVLL